MPEISNTTYSHMVRKAAEALKAGHEVRILIEGQPHPIQIQEIGGDGFTGAVAFKGITTPPVGWTVPGRNILGVCIVETQ